LIAMERWRKTISLNFINAFINLCDKCIYNLAMQVKL
jgi:hypothetical protein